MKATVVAVSMILLASAQVFASEPFDDYSFSCVGYKAPNSHLKVDAGVDPGGGFATSIASTGEWHALNGLLYVAKRDHSKTGEVSIFTSPKYVSPAVTVRIDWDAQISKDTFKGSLSQKGYNGDQPVELSCEIAL
jgi:hypothetical protein